MSTAKPAVEKMLPLERLAERIREWQSDGKRVAHCHGCFDILHAGHLRHFEQAADLADALVVTVTPDRFVNKGPNRPVFPEAARAEIIAGLAVVDFVAVNRWQSAVPTIELLRADVFVKGSEYESRADEVNPLFFAEAKAVEGVGGQIAFTRGFTMSSTAAFKRQVGAP
ncbi:MAG: adenylyltransferase/cytidyltransferase family protein [Gemmatimonadaceae bacterium]